MTFNSLCASFFLSLSLSLCVCGSESFFRHTRFAVALRDVVGFESRFDDISPLLSVRERELRVGGRLGFQV